MLHLSKNEIEKIANEVLEDFLRRPLSGYEPIDIEKLAGDYLGLEQRYIKLSDRGTPLGLTTFGGIELELHRYGRTEKLIVAQDTVLLEEAMLRDKKNGRRRFTLSHECAHQVLCRYEESKSGHSSRKNFVAGRTYSCRDLLNVKSWEEWQANVLGAFLLMPEVVVRHAYFLFCGNEVLNLYGFDNRMERKDYIPVLSLCDYLGVSLAALAIRLKDLGLAVERPYREYHDPLDIWVDEEESYGSQLAANPNG